MLHVRYILCNLMIFMCDCTYLDSSRACNAASSSFGVLVETLRCFLKACGVVLEYFQLPSFASLNRCRPTSVSFQNSCISDDDIAVLILTGPLGLAELKVLVGKMCMRSNLYALIRGFTRC